MSSRLDVVQSHLRGGKSAGSVVVVGSCFLDYIAYAKRAPSDGETLHSDYFLKGFGGKGANQAVMAATLGSRVLMVSAVGSDGDGDAYKQQLKRAGVDTMYLLQIPNESTGLAMITVSASTGQNQIVICPNATHCLTPDRIPFVDIFANGDVDVVIVQNEIPLESTLYTLKYAHEISKTSGKKIYTVFNSAPAPTPEQVKRIIPYLPYVSLFCPNETEASLLTGIEVTDKTSAVRAFKILHDMGIADVVITLGSQGYMISERSANTAPRHFPASKVGKAVDTTGAGDCFVGTMAHYLCRGWSLEKACAAANICAGMSVIRKGTQSSYPKISELPREMQ